MGRNRIHDEQASYFEKYGSTSYAYNKKSPVTPNFIYEVYIVNGHYKHMNATRMKELLKQAMPGLTQHKKDKVKEILKQIGR